MVTIKDYMKSLYLILKGDLCYTTPITDDVIGYANEQKIKDTLNRIKTL